MKAVTSDAHPWRARRSPRRTVLLLVLGTLGSIVLTASPVAKAAGTVSGTVYRDSNNNGVHDGTEPGVAGVVVAAGQSSTITNADGAWSMSLNGSVTVRVVSGWYRSQCNGLNCPAGPGADQDFPVTAQMIVATVTAESNPVLDTGVIPDWQGGYPIPSARPVPTNTVDVSARVSFVAPTGGAGSNCFRTGEPANRACAIGDQPRFLAQVYNEGTTPITNPSGYLELPPGTNFVSMAPATAPADHPGVPSVTLGGFETATRRLPFTMNGSLPPAGAALFTVTLLVVPGAPITTAFQTQGGYPNPIGIRITNVASDAENDGCAATAASCKYGQTNKQVSPDNSDTVGFAIVAGQVTPPPPTTPPATVAPTTTTPPTTTAPPTTTTPPTTTAPPTTTTRPPSTTTPTGGDTCTVSDLLVPSCGAWLGASAPPKNDGAGIDQGLSEYESVAKNTPDILHFYKSGSGQFPTSAEKALASRPGKQRSLLLYNWRGAGTWRSIADGSSDSAIASIATGIKAYPYKIFLTISHEPENEFKTTAGSGMTPADYVAMYRHVVTELRSLNVDNAVIVWNMMGFSGWASVMDAFYPGNDYVDWIAYDPYGHAAQTDFDKFVNRPAAKQSWPGFYTWATQKAPGKPIMMAEWGYILSEQPNAPAILDGAVDVLTAKYPMLKALVYWNQSGPFAVRLDQTTSVGIAYGQAYARMAADPYFNSTSTAQAP